jgi:hypothetical protein
VRTEFHPYAVLGAVIARELDAPEPRFSRKRKRLRAAIRARLAALVVEPNPPRGGLAEAA